MEFWVQGSGLRVLGFRCMDPGSTLFPLYVGVSFSKRNIMKKGILSIEGLPGNLHSGLIDFWTEGLGYWWRRVGYHV